METITRESREEQTMNLDDMRDRGITCNDCYLAMQNCHDLSICCEDETGLCDYFEPMKGADDETD